MIYLETFISHNNKSVSNIRLLFLCENIFCFCFLSWVYFNLLNKKMEDSCFQLPYLGPRELSSAGKDNA